MEKMTSCASFIHKDVLVVLVGGGGGGGAGVLQKPDRRDGPGPNWNRLAALSTRT